MEHITCFDVSS